MSGRDPTVSVVIPVWNEEPGIAGCLAAVAAQTWSTDDIEVIVVDGDSVDRTVEIAHGQAQALGLPVRVVSNPARRTSTSLNVGLDEAVGRILVRLDARSRVQPDYVSTCVAVLDADPFVGVVGGAQMARAESTSLVSRGIARSLRNRWFTGFSRYRRATCSGPADTVWMGVFRTGELRELGGWDGRVALNEDFELNQRYRGRGQSVWFDVGLRSEYVPRPNLGSLARQYFFFGRVKGTWWARGQRLSVRQGLLLCVPVVAGWVLVRSARRSGVVVTLGAALAGGLALDLAGAPERPESVTEVGVSMVAAAVTTSAWLGGIVVGFVGERVGVTHTHA